MKLLFCCHGPLSRELGTPKVLLELSEHLRPLGWQCDVRGRDEIFSVAPGGATSQVALRAYLQRHAPDYDVVEYDHKFLPFPRADFCPTTLFVARSFLLIQHLEKFPTPLPKAWKARLKQTLKSVSMRAEHARAVRDSDETLRQADLVNVNNREAVRELVARGIAPQKIVNFGHAIDLGRRAAFDAISAELPAAPVVAFVGSFDYRKGATDFPVIVKEVLARVPDARFKLLGTAGLFATESEVRGFFSPNLNAHIDIVPRFKSNELPALLAPCSLGIFPSYREGFPYSVIEMLAAWLPVIAYDAPGAPMMLPAKYLVPTGDTGALSAKVVELLSDAEQLKAARIWANARSREFAWDDIARGTSEVYQHHLAALREKS